MEASINENAPGTPCPPSGVSNPRAEYKKPRFDRARIAGLLPVAAVIVPLSILALGGLLTWWAVWDDARSDMLRAAKSVAEYGARTLESYSFAADRLNDRLHGLADAGLLQNEESLHRELQHIGAELSQTEVAYVIDRDGFPPAGEQHFSGPARRFAGRS